MYTYEITQPYQHELYSAKIGHFDIEIDIEFENGLSTVLLSSTIGSVVFFEDKIQRALDFQTAVLYYKNDDLIQDIVDLSNERLREIKQLTKELTNGYLFNRRRTLH